MKWLVVAFCNIEGKIHKKAKQQVADLAAGGGSSDNDDDDYQDENGNLVNQNPMFDLDGDVDLESQFLQGMLSDTQMTPTLEQATPAETVHSEMKDCEPTEDDWENM